MAVFVERPWYRDRVVIIGDAAHATSPHVGQGAAMAIEDALVLAEEVTADGPLDAALERFMDRRYERCRTISRHLPADRALGDGAHARRRLRRADGQSIMVTAEPI